MTLKLGKSIIHGRGVFAARDYRRGERLLTIKGSLKQLSVRTKKQSLSFPNWIGYGNGVWIDPIDISRYLNHSCNPNAGVRGAVTIVALKRIRAGDEVMLDYSIVEGDERWRMHCRCGAYNCRQVVGPIDSLPPHRFVEYLPNIPTYFVQLYIRRHSERNGSTANDA